MSVSEKAFQTAVKGKKLGFKFRIQHPVGGYFLDFYCPEAALCVEIDGPHHGQQRAYDAQRDNDLTKLGILTLRIPTEDLWEPTSMRFGHWIDFVQKTCEERTGRKAFPED